MSENGMLQGRDGRPGGPPAGGPRFGWLGLALRWGGAAAFVAAVVAGLAWLRQGASGGNAPAPAAPPPSTAAPQVPPPPSPDHPLEPAAAEPIPALEASDAPFLSVLTRLSGVNGLARWIRPEHLIGNIVASVDALPRNQVPRAVVPITPVPGSLLVSRQDGQAVIDAANARRYLPWVHIVLATDPAAAAAEYRRYYPLFQQAYRQLGYPNGYFNDRLIEAIDDVLAAPQPSAPLKVESPSVMWRYADPELESLSAGQKILLRLGPQSAKAVRAWLASFRAKIA